MVLFPSSIFFLLFSIASPDTAPRVEYLYSFGDFSSARSLSVTPSGQIYVVDTGNNKLKVYSASGDSIHEIGGYGWGQLEFDRPYDVYTGTGLNIYVADFGNHRVQRFDKDLNYISTFYTRESEDIEKRFGYPTAVALSRQGDLFIIDGENVRVLKVNPSSVIERTFGGIDAGKGRLRNPRRLNVTSKDLVCVLDEKRIVFFDIFGNYIRTVGEGVLKHPSGMTVENDKIYVADGEEIYLFNTAGKLLNTFQLGYFGPDTRQLQINDIAVLRGLMLVLTDRLVLVFRWSQESP